MTRLLLPFAAVLAISACGDDDAMPDGAMPDGAMPDGAMPDGAMPDAGSPDAGGVPTTLGPAERPARLVVPPAHDGVTPLPLMMLLHGYSASADVQDLYFRASATARARGYYLILPDGTIDSRGNRFWNATPACCDFGGTGVDDVGYLTSLLDEAESLLPVDAARVYVYGHSNGGFMSYRMACERADRITAIVSLAGGDFPGDTDCVPTRGVSVLEVHGTADDTIQYDGTVGYPSARDAVLRWAGRDGCDPSMSSTGTPLDLDSSLDGAETTVEQWTVGCDAGIDAELWSIVGGGHIPAFTAEWPTSVADWLLRHAR